MVEMCLLHSLVNSTRAAQLTSTGIIDMTDRQTANMLTLTPYLRSMFFKMTTSFEYHNTIVKVHR